MEEAGRERRGDARVVRAVVEAAAVAVEDEAVAEVVDAPKDRGDAADRRAPDTPTAPGQAAYRTRPEAGPTSHGSAFDLFTVVVLFVVALAYFSLTLDRTFNLRDEGYLLRMSSRVARGEIPHRDFYELYGPGVLAEPIQEGIEETMHLLEDLIEHDDTMLEGVPA